MPNNNPSGKGGFQKGNIPNPAGRPKKDNVLKELCKKATPSSFQRINDIAHHGEEEASRLKANQWICEYAYGKASQAVDLEVSGSVTVVANVFEKKPKA